MSKSMGLRRWSVDSLIVAYLRLTGVSTNRPRESSGFFRSISEAIGDKGQLQKWTGGERPKLPLKLKVKVASYTGYPLVSLLDRTEKALVREIRRLTQ
jgi:hypothetical protein